MNLPFHRPYIGPEEEAAVLRVLRSGWLTNGPETVAFEREFAAYLGMDEALGVSSCTAGLELIFATLDLPCGSEVITSPLTFAATVHVLVHHGLQPVLADIDPRTGGLDPQAVARRLSPQTAAVVVVHYAGHLAVNAELLEFCSAKGLILIEDCAHAIETRDASGQAAGTFGHAAAFSFYPNKNMTAAEGGMVVARDPALRERMRLLRTQGIRWPDTDGGAGFRPYNVLEAGYKLNLTDVQAAIGRVQLGRIDGWLPRRKAIADRYRTCLARLGGRLVEPPPGTRSAWHLAVAVLSPPDRPATEACMERIQRRGVRLSWHYRPIHWLTAYRSLPGNDDLPACNELASRCFSLPLYPTLSDEEVGFVCKVLEEELA